MTERRVSDFRVSKLRVHVRMLIFDQVREGTLFLTPLSTAHEGAETVHELLMGSDAFLPAEVKGKAHLLPVRALAAVWAPAASAIHEPTHNETPPPQTTAVRIKLASGTFVSGLLRYSLPDDQCRPVDFLNQAGPFFPVFQKSGKEVVLVHSQHVAWVQIETSRSRPRRRKTTKVGAKVIPFGSR